MDIIERFTDFGAPEFNVTGVASIERISTGQVRITKYSHRRDGNVVMFHEIWDVEAYRRAASMVKDIMEEIIQTPPEIESESGQPHGRH